MSRDDAHLRDGAQTRSGISTRGCDPSRPKQPRRLSSRRAQTAEYIVGPNGDIITVADLPSPGTTRWVIRRKAEVVLAVHGGLLSLEDACRRYQLTAEEFSAWQRAIERYGLLGLRSTHLQRLPARRVGLGISWVFRRSFAGISRIALMVLLLLLLDKGEDHDSRTHSTGRARVSRGGPEEQRHRGSVSPESPAAHKSSVAGLEKLLEDAEYLLDYAAGSGIKLDEGMVKTIVAAEAADKLDNDETVKAIAAVTALSAALQPVTAKTLGLQGRRGQDGEDLPAHRHRAWALPAGVIDLLLCLEPALGTARVRHHGCERACDLVERAGGLGRREP